NVLEAAVYGIPVVFGPEYEKFAEAVGLVDAGAGFPIDNALELESELTRLLENEEDYLMAAEAAAKYVKGNAGATSVVLRYIQENRLLTN
ncbi:MAG: 3-deoxy-D-manno-octulosonic acid transferase, partial [Bacteroidota bacterium]|nr:3-deoxy-D-manno-octulosonic acid transferase [Bacteroidota bacterium]